MSPGAVATAWVLHQPQVAATIVGVRHRGHLSDTLASAQVRLDPEDHSVIAAVQSLAPGPSRDVYGLERIKGGRHAAIMRYNLQT